MKEANKMSTGLANHADTLKGDVLQWLNSLCESPGFYRYSASACRRYAGEASSQAVCILWELGELATMPSAQKQCHISALQSFQNANGMFHDPLHEESDRLDKNHRWEKIYEHLSGACEQALALLGATTRIENHTPPIFNINELEPDDWIMGLDHREQPWGRCQNVAFSLLWYRRQSDLKDRLDAKASRVYELIENVMLNPEDGMPGAVDHPIGRRVAGYYMLTFCYLPYQRELPNPSRAIDLILKSLTPEGEIGEGGMCLNWDAAYVLNHVCRQLNWSYRHDEVCELLDRLVDFLWQSHRRHDGGFSFHRDSCLQIHNQVRIAPCALESDTHGTQMALASINIARAIKNRKYHPTFLEATN